MESPALMPSDLTKLLSSSASSQTLPAEQLVETLSELESAACRLFTDDTVIDPGDVALLQLYYSAHLFALLLVDDLQEARFLTHRFPPSLAQTDSVLARSKDVLRALWARRYPLVHQALRHADWPTELQPLVDRYLGHFRTSTLHLLSRAYTSIPFHIAALYLGVEEPDDPTKTNGAANNHPAPSSPSSSSLPSPTPATITNHEQLLAQFTSFGWTWDSSNAVFFLPPPHQSSSSSSSSSSVVHHPPSPNNNVEPSSQTKDTIARLVTLIGDLGE